MVVLCVVDVSLYSESFHIVYMTYYVILVCRVSSTGGDEGSFPLSHLTSTQEILPIMKVYSYRYIIICGTTHLFVSSGTQRQQDYSLVE